MPATHPAAREEVGRRLGEEAGGLLRGGGTARL